MIKGENLKTASTGSWRSCVAWNILVQPLITSKGTVKLSDTTGHSWKSSAPCQRPRNHVGQNTWTMWYTPITARGMNQLTSDQAQIVPSLVCLLMSALATIGPDTESHRTLSSFRIWTKSDWLIQEPLVTKMCVCEALAKELPLRTTSNLKLVLVL